MNEIRERVADRLAREIAGYLIDEVFRGADLPDAVWDRMDPPSREMMRAIGAFERGEIDFSELEAAGVRYVEAWVRQAASSSKRVS